MADRLFIVDDRDMKNMERLMKLRPRQFAAAAGSLLNEFAFGTKNTVVEVIAEKMTVRNIRFVESRIYVQKARKSQPIESQKAEVGSTYDRSKRFSGWREQQLGTKTARKRTITLLGRRKSIKRKLAGPARLKPNVQFESAEDYAGNSMEQKNIHMISRLARLRWNMPFIITGKRGMVPGLYKFVRRRPRLLQVFDPVRVQPKKIPWMTTAVSRYFQRESLDRLWGRILKFNLKR